MLGSGFLERATGPTGRGEAGGEETENAYEAARRRKMAENRAMLEQLGLLDEAAHVASAHRTDRQSKKRARARGDAELPRRQSRRTKGEAPSDSVPPPSAADAKTVPSMVAEQAGARGEDGKWRGERFGKVDDVPVGTVFGAGDYQRQGRFEMSASGFFAPPVQPEWLEPGRGLCILVEKTCAGDFC
jgi:hypothetical protein